ncbi:unnamed protein product [Sympodiomycopsis kandeliae]
MRSNSRINIARTTLLSSLILLLAVFAYQSKAHNALSDRRALQHHERAFSGSSGSSGPPRPTTAGPAWHEHPMWNHPALYEGAKLFPSPSSSPKLTGPHSPTHSTESTGTRPLQVDKGKGVASVPAVGKTNSPAPAQGSGRKVEIYSLDKDSGFKSSMAREKRPWSKAGRPVGSKEAKQRDPYNMNKRPKQG